MYLLLLRLLLIHLVLFPTLVFAQEFYDDPSGVRTFRESRIGDSLFNQNTDLTRVLKDNNEVDNYMRCYLDQRLRNEQRAAARMKEFEQVYKPFLLHAVQAFQIPYALSACVMFRETFLDNDAVSSAGAQTIAQFTEDTYETLKTHIRLTRERESDYQEFLQMQERSENLLNSQSNNLFVKCHQFTQGEGPFFFQTSQEERKNSVALCRKQLSDFHLNRRLLGEMKAYLWNSSRSMEPSVRRRYFSTPAPHWPQGSDLLPPSSFQRFKDNPMWLAAMNIFYLKRLTLVANRNFNRLGFTKSDDYLGYFTVIAGSYNRGSKALNDIVSRPQGSVEKWCQRIEDVEETKDYMLSIKRCMAKGSNFPMTGMTQSQACRQQPQGVTNIDSPCEVLNNGTSATSEAAQPTQPPASVQ